MPHLELALREAARAAGDLAHAGVHAVHDAEGLLDAGALRVAAARGAPAGAAAVEAGPRVAADGAQDARLAQAGAHDAVHGEVDARPPHIGAARAHGPAQAAPPGLGLELHL